MQVHPVPNLGKMEAASAPVITDSPIQQDTQQQSQCNPFDTQPQQDPNQLDLANVHPEPIEDHQLQLLTQPQLQSPDQQDLSNPPTVTVSAHSRTMKSAMPLSRSNS